MKKINMDEMKCIQLSILKDVADFCEENGIRYCLYGGTLLGAIRHKGYIPWDDDIDIAMPRPDYERFIGSYKSEYYNLLHWQKTNHCLCTYMKVYDNRTTLIENGDLGETYGINIDVFPIDGLPKEEFKIDSTVRKMKALWGLVVCGTIKDISRRKVRKKIAIILIRLFYKIVPIKHYVTGLVVHNAQKYPFDYSDKVAVLVWGNGRKEVIGHQTASKYIKADFENYKFNIPENYEEYLISVYGDYMTPPPEATRQLNHSFIANWKDKF